MSAFGRYAAIQNRAFRELQANVCFYLKRTFNLINLSQIEGLLSAKSGRSINHERGTEMLFIRPEVNLAVQWRSGCPGLVPGTSHSL